MRSYVLLLLLLPFISFSQPTRQPDAAGIHQKLKKLNFLGSVLYMAAHPDDENTNIIAYLSNEKLATTAYLSLTRGDGGQNLIGPEIREQLGLIRTQELLAARRIDGGQQFFTRAIDFGFSKSADEAFAVWGREAVLSDAVKVLRQYQPDVIITRFPPDERAGHGHHTASAIVAQEAFELAADPKRFPELANSFGTWQVRRLYTNTGRWWNQTVNENSKGVIVLDVGGYNTLLGKSYSEISALSSSQHKSQGWGRKGERGYRPEFLEYVKGDSAKEDIFERIDTSWGRIPGGEKVQPLITRALKEFNSLDPAASVPMLLKIRKEIMALGDGVWQRRKLGETEQLIIDCLGLFVEATASHFQFSPGDHVDATLEVVNRTDFPVKVSAIRTPGLQWDSVFDATLRENRPMLINARGRIDLSAEFSGPYWLEAPPSTGLYSVKDKAMIGRPENSPPLTFSFDIQVAGEALTLSRPLIYKWVDPVKGELWRPLEIVPPVTVNLSEDVMVFSTPEAREIELLIRSFAGRAFSGVVKFELPEGWLAEPSSLLFKFDGRGEEQLKSVKVFPSQAESTGSIQAAATVDGKTYSRSLRVISYDHFPIQTLLPPAASRIVRIDLKKNGERIGYVRGAGDEIPSALRNMGYDVVELDNADVTPARLKGLDAVVLGVRALNTNDRARYFMPAVLEYVKNGGTVVVQYNTNSRLQTERFAPYPLRIGRDRVTDETADVRILKPDHAVMNIPNKINSSDFDGWLQERGLYFPMEWDPSYEAILSMNDKGESPKNSSLLVAKYGSGYYVYTGLSFFRELPEGVPGAYKLFANLVSLGKAPRAETRKVKDRSK